MDCELTPILSEYLDGELDAGDRLRVEAHVEECPACQATLEDFRSIGSAVAGYSPATGPFYGRRALASILSRGRTSLWRRRVSIPAVALPAVALVAAGGALVISRALPDPRAARPAPSPANAILKYDRGRPPIIAVIPTAVEREELP